MIDMSAGLEARVGELERLRASRDLSPCHVFDDVTLVTCNLQQVLAGGKIDNVVGKIKSERRQQQRVADDDSTVVDKSRVTSGRRTSQISVKGSLVVRDCTADGKCVTVENTSTKTQSLGGWTLTRNIDGDDLINFSMPRELTISSRAKLKLWCAGCKPAGDSACDVETTQTTWGVGDNIVTRLVNQAGQECATHRQMTTYS